MVDPPRRLGQGEVGQGEEVEVGNPQEILWENEQEGLTPPLAFGLMKAEGKGPTREVLGRGIPQQVRRVEAMSSRTVFRAVLRTIDLGDWDSVKSILTDVARDHSIGQTAKRQRRDKVFWECAGLGWLEGDLDFLWAMAQEIAALS
jgi:hypothetical protein